jgi:GH15 family glucan-1,4-alpha-glucosidase
MSTFTAASVYGALASAAHFADLLGKEEDARTYQDVADSIKQGILTHLYRDDMGYFLKLLNENDAGELEPDTTIDASSFFGVFHFGVLPSGDKRLETALTTLQQTLSDPIPVGGIARYEGDAYFARTEDVPGNPWFITTLWCIQYMISRATCSEELASVNTELQWIADRAISSGILSEQLDPHTGEPVSVMPLSWSHGEYVRTVVQYMRKLERLGEGNACEPIE